ncbi:MAG: hypothetical protein FJY29_12790 [Betaproteobacteria bacterium]|nr:hypothetical protein [Betaproteobacteria bacterium]
MKSFLSLSLALIVAQGCGQLSLSAESDANRISSDTRIPEKNEMVSVDSQLDLKAAGDEKAAEAVEAGSEKAPEASVSADADKKLAALKVSSAAEKPSLARVTFQLLPEAGVADKSLSEKVVLEEKFPADVGAASIQSKSSLKLRQERSYKVTVEQIKDAKVLQTTTLTFEFKRKSRQKLEIATSQLSGVMLRYGKSSSEVLRECPAGQFMSGIGFNDIPICRVVEASVAPVEAAKKATPAVIAPDAKEKAEEKPTEEKKAAQSLPSCDARRKCAQSLKDKLIQV